MNVSCSPRRVVTPITFAISMAALPVMPGVAVGATFEPLSQSRSVELFAKLDAVNFETMERDSAVFNDSHSLPAGWDPLQMGMDINLLESCFGQGVAKQDFTARGESIHFEGLADVNISGFANYPFIFEGVGGASVALDYRFAVTKATDVELFMNSSIGMYRDDDYTFSISTIAGQTLWSSVGVVEGGEPTRTFSTRLTLGAAEYVVKANLRASSAFSDGYSTAGRTWAQFSVTAIPEPHAVFLVLFGAVVVMTDRHLRGKVGKSIVV